MRRPGIEPGSTAWKAAMLTIIPPTPVEIRNEIQIWDNFLLTFYHNLEIVGQFYDKRFPVYDLLKIQRFCVICCRLNWVKKRWCIAYRFRALIIVYNNKYILVYGLLISLCSSYYVQKVLSRVFQTFANKR